jgi:hypothetical protein
LITQLKTEFDIESYTGVDPQTGVEFSTTKERLTNGDLKLNISHGSMEEELLVGFSFDDYLIYSTVMFELEGEREPTSLSSLGGQVIYGLRGAEIPLDTSDSHEIILSSLSGEPFINENRIVVSMVVSIDGNIHNARTISMEITP